MVKNTCVDSCTYVWSRILELIVVHMYGQEYLYSYLYMCMDKNTCIDSCTYIWSRILVFIVVHTYRQEYSC